jgi:predicted RNA-binding protein with PIN domain
MPYIIDGNNLVGCAPDISLDDPEARARIIQIIGKFQESRQNSVIIVFDGHPDGGVRRYDAASKFSVVYPRDGHTADDEIREILSGFNYYKDVILVSSDRELKTYARKKGARTVNSIEFYFELKRTSHIYGKKEENQKRIDATLSDMEIDQWLKIFDDA